LAESCGRFVSSEILNRVQNDNTHAVEQSERKGAEPRSYLWLCVVTMGVYK